MSIPDVTLFWMQQICQLFKCLLYSTGIKDWGVKNVLITHITIVPCICVSVKLADVLMAGYRVVISIINSLRMMILSTKSRGVKPKLNVKQSQHISSKWSHHLKTSLSNCKLSDNVVWSIDWFQIYHNWFLYRYEIAMNIFQKPNCYSLLMMIFKKLQVKYRSRFKIKRLSFHIFFI